MYTHFGFALLGFAFARMGKYLDQLGQLLIEKDGLLTCTNVGSSPIA